jgi:hypothetical protein
LWRHKKAYVCVLLAVRKETPSPSEDGSICDPKYIGVNFTWTFNVFLINTELWVYELVIIETGQIDARCKHEVQ